MTAHLPDAYHWAMGTFLSRLYNPTGRDCGCPPGCICQRSPLGRAFQWYIPGRFHTPLPLEAKAAAEAQGKSFGSV